RLSRELAGKHGVCSVAPFGQTLHVSGTDRAELEKLIAPYRREPYRWTEVEPTLEDVFIRLLHGQNEHRDQAA
ncbi:MAG TPA: ABC transporter ATP-binding protein, partial [Sphingomicrobium sp.]|nr:ABC transporter ATP-binding protein [Sphingomicrobium sp.]